MLTLHMSEQDETKFWMSELGRQKTNPLYTPQSPAAGRQRLTVRECRKLYGTNKYRADGTLYTAAERPWLFVGGE